MIVEHSGWRLEVATGLHAGALVTLAEGRHALGAAPDSDIMLADPGIAATVAVLDIAAGGAQLHVAAAGIRLSRRRLGRRRLADGASVALRHGTEMLVGDVRLRVLGPSGRPDQARRRPWRHSAWLVPAWLMVALPACIAAVVAMPMFKALSLPTQTQPFTPARVRPPAQPSATPAPDKLVSLVRDELARRGLDDTITLAPTEAAVIASGTVDPRARQSWIEAQMWFDGQARGAAMLVDRVRVAAADAIPDLDIRAVSAGAVPYLVTGAGERYTIGVVLPGGWTVASIAANEVVLRKGGRSVSIAL